MIFPNRETFRDLARHGNLIPVYTEIVADVETPISAFMKLDTGSNSFLLESAEREERFGRYSFVGVEPAAVFRADGKTITISEHGQSRSFAASHDPLDELRQMMESYRPVTFGDLPIFYGGAVGFLGYEIARFFEPRVKPARIDDLGLPDAYFMITRSLLIFDHVTRRIKVVVNTPIGDDPDRAYDQAARVIDDILKRLRRPISHVPLPADRDHEITEWNAAANMTKDEYIAMTSAMKRHIFEGDIFQVVPSQRFSIPFIHNAIDLYRALRFVNPSPYMFCLNLDGFSIVGSSPETHVRCEQGKVEIHPIAGTRPRKLDPDQDEAMALELLADPKERAEHVMLVDLARNDVGRVCDFHSVRVTEFMTIERYSHVMHIVSRVQGILRPEFSAFDVMRATFPAGTVSGSPKVRAMEIIGELEPTCRGIYSGAVGYFGFSGNLDSCIAIRTVLLKNGTAYVQAGGGLVADSTPEGEYQESVNKAKSSIRALALVEKF
jgi:anthranilate synthase component 1